MINESEMWSFHYIIHDFNEMIRYHFYHVYFTVTKNQLQFRKIYKVVRGINNIQCTLKVTRPGQKKNKYCLSEIDFGN